VAFATVARQRPQITCSQWVNKTHNIEINLEQWWKMWHFIHSADTQCVAQSFSKGTHSTTPIYYRITQCHNLLSQTIMALPLREKKCCSRAQCRCIPTSRASECTTTSELLCKSILTKLLGGHRVKWLFWCCVQRWGGGARVIGVSHNRTARPWVMAAWGIKLPLNGPCHT
jgi:hypothetical protein